MGGGSDLQRLSGGENCVLGPRRGVPSHVIDGVDSPTTPGLRAIAATPANESRRWRINGPDSIDG